MDPHIWFGSVFYTRCPSWRKPSIYPDLGPTQGHKDYTSLWYPEVGFCVPTIMALKYTERLLCSKLTAQILVVWDVPGAMSAQSKIITIFTCERLVLYISLFSLNFWIKASSSKQIIKLRAESFQKIQSKAQFVCFFGKCEVHTRWCKALFRPVNVVPTFTSGRQLH